jgi:hypothetical protein
LYNVVFCTTFFPFTLVWAASRSYVTRLWVDGTPTTLLPNAGSTTLKPKSPKPKPLNATTTKNNTAIDSSTSLQTTRLIFETKTVITGRSALETIQVQNLLHEPLTGFRTWKTKPTSSFWSVRRGFLIDPATLRNEPMMKNLHQQIVKQTMEWEVETGVAERRSKGWWERYKARRDAEYEEILREEEERRTTKDGARN